MPKPPLTQNDLPQEIRSQLGAIRHLTYPIRQGYTSNVAVVESTQGKCVIKRSQGLPFSDWLRQEYRVLQALAPLALPTPNVYLFVSREGSAGPDNWLLMDYIPGSSLREVLQIESDTMIRHSLLQKFGQVLATIHHTIPPPELTSDNQPWLTKMLKCAEENLYRYEVDGTQELLEQLQKTRPVPTTPTLLHGDFTIDNTLINDGGVSGVIDWPDGAVGDPRYDIALAIRPKPNVFQMPDDFQAFFEGYGETALSSEDYQYFVKLYEFF